MSGARSRPFGAAVFLEIRFRAPPRRRPAEPAVGAAAGSARKDARAAGWAEHAARAGFTRKAPASSPSSRGACPALPEPRPPFPPRLLIRPGGASPVPGDGSLSRRGSRVACAGRRALASRESCRAPAARRCDALPSSVPAWPGSPPEAYVDGASRPGPRAGGGKEGKGQAGRASSESEQVSTRRSVPGLGGCR